MKIGKWLGYISIMIAAVGLVGCGSIPKEQQKNYALVVSRVGGEYGSDMDAVPFSSTESTAMISYIDGRTIFPAKSSVNLAPGEYKIQLGMRCGSSTTCHPGDPYILNLEPGKRYVLKPNGNVYVSDRFSDRSNEALYRSARK